MKSKSNERALSWIAVGGMVAVLIVLAVLQYRWSGQVSEAASSRMQANLQNSLAQFRNELTRELTSACYGLQPESASNRQLDYGRYAQQVQHWRQSAGHPRLVDGVYLSDSNKPSELLRVNAAGVEQVSWPDDMVRLRDRLNEMPAAPPGQAQNEREQKQNFHPGDDHGELHSPHGPPVACFIDQSVPALIRQTAVQDRGSQAASSWVIIRLNRQLLEKHVLPELAQKYFPTESDYVIAILGDGGNPVLFSSDPKAFASAASVVDGGMTLWGPPGRARDSERRGPDIPPPPPGGAQRIEGRRGRAFGVNEASRLEPLHYGPDEHNWELVVKHRKGSVEAAVAALRRRNLAVSFAILLLLAGTTALIIVTSQRARRLAQLQMDFVAGVSHELRTPLAVISSAAENLADGVVSSQPQVAKYGSAIRDQAKQLTGLVEQVLLYAKTSNGKPQHHLRSLHVEDVLKIALRNTGDMIARARVTVENDIETDLPEVKADFNALAHCVQNLITNAVKYGGSGRWLGVSARRSGEEVQITVADHGPGIPAEERERIFEPFYRSRTAIESQIHGTGLGLPLTKTNVEAMGGKLTLSSEERKGTSFTIHLPALREAASDAEIPSDETADPRLKR